MNEITVVLAHVKRIVHSNAKYNLAYKVRIKKEFKVSSIQFGIEVAWWYSRRDNVLALQVTEQGRAALAYGRILTPSHDASCGIRLRPGRRYVLTGTINQGKPWINLCNWHEEWDRMTSVQRKGFRKLYDLQCDCKVSLFLVFLWLSLIGSRCINPHRCLTRTFNQSSRVLFVLRRDPIITIQISAMIQLLTGHE